MDHLSREKRSQNMAAIHSEDTSPEIAVRKMVYALGYRYRLHVPDLPGKPDLVFPSRKKILFVHGCFWHCHNRCKRATIPKTRTVFWRNKLSANAERDRRRHHKRSLMHGCYLTQKFSACAMREIPGEVENASVFAKVYCENLPVQIEQNTVEME